MQRGSRTCCSAQGLLSQSERFGCAETRGLSFLQSAYSRIIRPSQHIDMLFQSGCWRWLLKGGVFAAACRAAVQTSQGSEGRKLLMQRMALWERAFHRAKRFGPRESVPEARRCSLMNCVDAPLGTPAATWTVLPPGV